MNVRSAVVNVSATDRKSTRLNSSHTEIYTLSLHDALPIFLQLERIGRDRVPVQRNLVAQRANERALRGRERVGHRSEEHTSELQSHRDLHSFPTRRSSDLPSARAHRSRSRPGTAESCRPARE